MWGSGTVAVFAHEADKRKRIIIDFHNFRIVKKQLLTDCTKSNGEMPKRRREYRILRRAMGDRKAGFIKLEFQALDRICGRGYNNRIVRVRFILF